MCLYVYIVVGSVYIFGGDEVLMAGSSLCLPRKPGGVKIGYEIFGCKRTSVANRKESTLRVNI